MTKLRKKIINDRTHTCQFRKMSFKKKKMLDYDTDLDVRECRICGFRYFKGD
jgi:hypothetical protein